MLEFPSSFPNFEIFIFESVNLDRSIEVARFPGGCDDLIDKIPTSFHIVRVLGKPSVGISLKLFEIYKFYFSIVQFQGKVESCQNFKRLR
jgi:hypothetical protein